MKGSRSVSGTDEAGEAGPPSPASDGTKMVRPRVDAAEALIGVKKPVLEHGYVVLVDYMGDDGAIVQAARVSYGKGTRTVRDDRGLIRYLMRHQHTTPFEMVEFKFLVRLPIYVARQWIRHRTASVNETSARYSVVPDEFDVPRPEAVQGQSRTNRQGREGELPKEVVERFRSDLTRVSNDAYKVYQSALDAGVARETARMVLPVNFYTEWYWKINLHNLFHFLALRLDEHAQEEIRLYARVLGEAVRTVTPMAFEAFEDFALHAVSLTRREKVAVRALLEGRTPESACSSAGLPLAKADGTPLKSGEGREFLAKLAQIRAVVAPP